MIKCALYMALFAARLVAADATGSWIGRQLVLVPGGGEIPEGPVFFFFQQSGNVLAGTARTGLSREFRIDKGGAQQGTLTFDIAMPDGASRHFVLQQQGDVLTGDAVLRMTNGRTKASRVIARRDGVTAPTTSYDAVPKAAIMGVWRVVEETNMWRTIKQPNPGYIFFTDSHYAIVREAQDIKRPSVTDFDNATPQELVAMWGPFVAQTGTYTLDGNLLSLTILVAKNKEKETTKEIQRVKVDGNTMMIWPAADAAGSALAKSIALRLVRAE